MNDGLGRDRTRKKGNGFEEVLRGIDQYYIEDG